jgi:hypothetical protein
LAIFDVTNQDMRNLYNLILLLTLLISAGNIANAQLTEIDPQEDNVPGEETAPEKKKFNEDSRFVFGGFLSAGFGNYTTVNISPLVGYRVTEKFTPGIGINYQYAQLKDPFYIDYKLNIIGGRIFLQHDILYGVFAHTEYEHLWYNLEFLEYPLTSAKDQVPGLFIGGGYRFQAGESGGLQIIALWNALWNPDNLVYPNPWTLRFSIMF